MPNPGLLTQEHIDKVCCLGLGAETCAFLACGGEGWCCTKNTDLETAIRIRIAAGTMVSKGDNCDGRTGSV